MMVTNLRGELTSSSISEVDQTLADALIVSLNIQSPKKLQEVVDQVYNALVLYAIDREDKSALRRILGMGANINAANSEGKPPLHEAIVKGNIDIVEYLLKHGASVHMKTRSGDTALMVAIFCENVKVIKILLSCGASILSIEPKYLCDTMANYAKIGDVDKLEIFKIAGADLEMTDEMGQAPLHKTVICNQIHATRYLWQQEMGRAIVDAMGFTPEDYARKLHRDEILAIFTYL